MLCNAKACLDLPDPLPPSPILLLGLLNAFYGLLLTAMMLPMTSAPLSYSDFLLTQYFLL